MSENDYYLMVFPVPISFVGETKAGITATWDYMVAGDIFATRWIWKKFLQYNINPIVRTLAIFFGACFNFCLHCA